MTEHEYREARERAEFFFPRFKKHLLSDVRHLGCQMAVSAEPVPYEQRHAQEYRTFREGMHWGNPWDSAWVRLEGEIPPEWTGHAVALRLNLGGESTVFDANGMPIYSLTNTSIFEKLYKKEYYHYTESAAPGAFQVWVEAVASGFLGEELHEEEMELQPSPRSCFGSVQCIQYGLFNRDVWQLMLDFEVVMSLVNCSMGPGYFAPPRDFTGCFPRGSSREKQLLSILVRAMDAFGDNPANAPAARQILAEALGRTASSSELEVTAVGHAHLDIGWLWPVRENIRKAARTFASQLTLMDKYPAYVFGASQPQLYQMVKDHFPELYARIRERVKDGRWELQGATWVEMDCNIPAGESLVRQFLHGKNFYRDEFGVEVRNLWLPDTFGYNGNLPQIMKGCRCDYFVTNKLAWNDTNRLPAHVFNWVGIDGSTVLAVQPPEGNYNAPMTPAYLANGEHQYSSPEILPAFLSLYGVGDGGGGPTEDFVERAIRCADLEGCPKVRMERAQQFLDRLPEYRTQLPSWHGDLYLERHRGTLTTHAYVKKAHRRCEESLLQTETLSAGFVHCAKYPREILDNLWKRLMLNQFHDILPGSAIASVYERAMREFQEIEDECQRLCARLGCNGDTGSVTLINTLGSQSLFLLELPNGWKGLKGHICQQTQEGKIFTLARFGAFESCILQRDDQAVPLEMDVGDGLDKQGRIVLACGDITCLFDSRSGRLLAVKNHLGEKDFSASVYAEQSGITLFDGNRFALYHDHPKYNDAWEVESFYRGGKLPVEQRLVNHAVRTGKLFSELDMELELDGMQLRQTVRVCRECPRIDFITKVDDWRLSHRMLRVSFRQQNLARPVAMCSTPYGATEQPTSANTSWEEARFEVPMQQWVDISERGVGNGFAILNDCKYGVSVRDGVADINLLRAPAYPDPTADRGPHEFTLSLLVHPQTDYRQAQVIENAHALNRTPACLNGNTCGIAWRLPLEFDKELDGLFIEGVKLAEKTDDLIVRVAEEYGNAGTLRFTTLPEVSSVTECDMLEWDDVDDLTSLRRRDASQTRWEYHIPFHPYEIKTFRVRLVPH